MKYIVLNYLYIYGLSFDTAPPTIVQFNASSIASILVVFVCTCASIPTNAVSTESPVEKYSGLSSVVTGMIFASVSKVYVVPVFEPVIDPFGDEICCIPSPSAV